MVLLRSISAALAQEKPCNCWIDVKTGKPVSTIPTAIGHAGADSEDARDKLRAIAYALADAHGSGQYHDLRTGQNLARDSNGCWTDIKTGKPVATIPTAVGHAGADSAEGRDKLRAIAYGVADAHGVGQYHDPKTGQNFVRVPCPPPHTSSTGGAIKSILSGVSIGVGGGTVGGHHHGDYVSRNDGGGRTFTRDAHNEGGGSNGNRPR